MEIVTALKIAGTVTKFVQGDQLLAAIAEVDVSAAAEAVRKAQHAEDPKSQMWSAINHLEGANEALKAASTAWFVRRVNQAELVDIVCRRENVLCLLAICYKYVGEKALGNEAIDTAEEARSGLSEVVYLDSANSRLRPLKDAAWFAGSMPSLLKFGFRMLKNRDRLPPFMKATDLQAFRSQLSLTPIE